MKFNFLKILLIALIITSCEKDFASFDSQENIFLVGTILFSALCARFPCPISLLEVPLRGLASPVEKGGKL